MRNRIVATGPQSPTQRVKTMFAKIKSYLSILAILCALNLLTTQSQAQQGIVQASDTLLTQYVSKGILTNDDLIAVWNYLQKGTRIKSSKAASLYKLASSFTSIDIYAESNAHNHRPLILPGDLIVAGNIFEPNNPQWILVEACHSSLRDSTGKDDRGRTEYKRTLKALAWFKGTLQNWQQWEFTLSADGTHWFDKPLLFLLRPRNADFLKAFAGEISSSGTLKSRVFAAANTGDVTALKSFLDAGANIEATDSFQRTALIVAAGEGKTGAVILLLDRGANINAVKDNGADALIDAAYNNHLDIVLLLLRRGSGVKAEAVGGANALTWAAFHGMDEAVQILLDRGADFHLRDISGNTALSFAQANGHTKIVRLLRDAGATR